MIFECKQPSTTCKTFSRHSFQPYIVNEFQAIKCHVKLLSTDSHFGISLRKRQAPASCLIDQLHSSDNFKCTIISKRSSCWSGIRCCRTITLERSVRTRIYLLACLLPHRLFAAMGLSASYACHSRAIALMVSTNYDCKPVFAGGCGDSWTKSQNVEGDARQHGTEAINATRRECVVYWG